MGKLNQLYLRLDTLTIFRNLLEDPVISAFQDFAGFFSLEGDDGRDSPFTEEKIGAYSHFVSELYKDSSSLTEYVKKAVLSDENFYIVGRGKDLFFDQVVKNALESDLEVLEDLATLTSREVKAEIPCPVSLPDWVTEDMDLKEIYRNRIDHLKQEGYGIFSNYFAFVFQDDHLEPIVHTDTVLLGDLPGYDDERNQVIQNTLALIEDMPSNNVLLYGDTGTGKTTTIRAVVNTYHPRGLRCIEVSNDQLVNLSKLMDLITDNPLKFIVFIDDLTISASDAGLSTLKSVLDGSMSYKGKNMAIYATSSSADMVRNVALSPEDAQRAEEESRALTSRFGIVVTFQPPEREDYLQVVYHLADKMGLFISREELAAKAEEYAKEHGERSPRTARHFIRLQSYLYD